MGWRRSGARPFLGAMLTKFGVDWSELERFMRYLHLVDKYFCGVAPIKMRVESDKNHELCQTVATKKNGVDSLRGGLNLPYL